MQFRIMWHESLAAGFRSRHDPQISCYYIALLMFRSSTSSVEKGAGFEVSFFPSILRC